MITYQNRKFETRELDLHDWGLVTVSTTSLGDLLFNNETGYPSKEAEVIDETIFFFVAENEIYLSDKELAKVVLKSL